MPNVYEVITARIVDKLESRYSAVAQALEC